MTEDNAPLDAEGQAAEAPDAADGQAVETTDATAPPEQRTSDAEDSFFDPSELPPELLPAYKSMQAAWTKKTQGLAADRRKIQEYDEFMRDPQGNLQRLMQRFGYSQPQQQEEFNPQSWDDVISQAKQQAIAEFQQLMAPVMNEIRGWKRNQLESQFDDAFPQWRQYEDEMSQMIQRHPSLVQDPDALLRAAIPREVFESQATQRALKKLRDKTEASKVSAGSRTVRNPDSAPGKMSFGDAVAFAKKQLAEQGITN